jgi:hypothetical protein
VLKSVEAFMHRIDRHEWSRCTHCGECRFVPTAPIAPAPVRLLHLGGAAVVVIR